MILKPFTVYEEIFLYLFYVIIKAQFMSVIFIHFVNDLCGSDTKQNCWVLSYHIIDSFKLTHIFQYLIKSDKKKNWDTVYLCHSFFEGNFLSWSFWVKFIFLLLDPSSYSLDSNLWFNILCCDRVKEYSLKIKNSGVHLCLFLVGFKSIYLRVRKTYFCLLLFRMIYKNV